MNARSWNIETEGTGGRDKRVWSLKLRVYLGNTSVPAIYVLSSGTKRRSTLAPPSASHGGTNTLFLFLRLAFVLTSINSPDNVQEADSSAPDGIRFEAYHYSDREPWTCLDARRDSDFDLHWECKKGSAGRGFCAGAKYKYCGSNARDSFFARCARPRSFFERVCGTL